MRKEAYITLIAVFLIWIQFGCDPAGPISKRTGDSTSDATAGTTDGTGSVQSQPAGPQPNPIPDTSSTQTNPTGGEKTFLMGSFNIRDFGRAKMSNEDVLPILVDIGRRFDLLAIQEVSDISQTTINRYVDMLNENGMSFAYVLGPRQGDPAVSQKEQYAYIYDSTKLEVIGESFVAPDPERYLQRSPLVTTFRCVETTPDKAFTFSLFNIHTDYDIVTKELLAMQVIVQNVVRQMPHEDDFIVLGDLNAAPKRFSQYPCLANQVAVIPDDTATNTRGDRNYDNILFDASRTQEFRGNHGVFDFMAVYGLSYQQAKAVSDHLPIWAEFSIYESTRPVVASPIDRIPAR